MSLFLHDSCTILHQFLQDLAKNVQEMQVIILAATLAKSCTISCKICARIVQEKGHVACTCQASLACKILARFLHDLASSFLLGSFTFFTLSCVEITKVELNNLNWVLDDHLFTADRFPLTSFDQATAYSYIKNGNHFHSITIPQVNRPHFLCSVVVVFCLVVFELSNNTFLSLARSRLLRTTN